MSLHPALYTHPTLPHHFVARESATGALALVPNVPDGWTQRRPYRGHVTGLERVAPETARVLVEHLGAGFFFLAPLSRDWIDCDYDHEPPHPSPTPTAAR